MKWCWVCFERNSMNELHVMWMSCNYKFLFYLQSIKGVSSCIIKMLSGFTNKKFSKALVKILFIWSYANFKLLMVTISFSLNILILYIFVRLVPMSFWDLWFLGLCFGFFQYFVRLVCVCPHNWHPYCRWDSKMA